MSNINRLTSLKRHNSKSVQRNYILKQSKIAHLEYHIVGSKLKVKIIVIRGVKAMVRFGKILFNLTIDIVNHQLKCTAKK